MRYSGLQVTFREIPDQISLCIHISGCPLACPGCHSADLWSVDKGIPLTADHFNELLEKYRQYVSCIVFMGGEWFPQQLENLLKIVKIKKIRTALYTGLELKDVSPSILAHLDYIKVGPYIAELGGLDSPKTNQRLIDLKQNKIIVTNTKEEVKNEIHE